MSISFLKNKQGKLRIGMATLLGALAIMVGFTNASAAPSQANGGEKAKVQAPAVTCPGGQCFADVAPGNTFFAFINSLYTSEIVSGYACGGAGEPCDADSRPYYRPGAVVTRGSMSKFVDLARPKPGMSLQVLPNSGLTAALTVIRDTPSTVGEIGGGGALGAVNFGNGADSDHPSSGIRAAGAGTQYSVGIFASATSSVGAWFTTSAPSSYYGAFIDAGGLQVGRSQLSTNSVTIHGPLTVDSGCTGCFLTGIMQNTGTTALHPGEVVSMSSAASGEMMGDSPIGGVEATGIAYNTAVVGVVAQRWIPAEPTAGTGTKARTGYVDDATVIQPGEYMTVVSSGAYKTIKVDASNGPIHAGDLLTTSTTKGAAMKVTNKMDAFGAVIGKAMGNLESGTGEIAVLITLK